ncbi:MAG TPA: alkaline phosphatase [Cryomorphaceae bacterium]|nr:alkaline phosphatase [Cryomorphaceae bacterium]
MKYFYLPILSLLSLSVSAQTLNFVKAGTYATGIFDDSGTEITAFDPASKLLFSTNGSETKLDVVDLSDIQNPTLQFQINLSTYMSGVNSVAVYNGTVAAVGEPTSGDQDPGVVAFFDIQGNFLKQLTGGAMPDMVTFTPDGSLLLIANEGEPNGDYTIDPEGSISIIDMSAGVANLTQTDVTQITFSALNGTNIDPLINIYGNDGLQTIAQDLEPEYITVNSSSTKAFVSVQENNAMAIIDLTTKTLDTIVGLGYVNRSVIGLDASNTASTINIATYNNLFGMYQPDAITAFEANGNTYIASANEGDARDYDTYSEEERIKDLTLDPTNFPNAATLQNKDVLGRLNITTSLGDNDGDGDYDSLFHFGARSFSIWNDQGQLVWDSGDEFEQYLAVAYPNEFNSNNDDNASFKSRSDDKGCEPEAITTGDVDGVKLAFIGLERMGGIMIYDVTNPSAPNFIMYELNRDFNVAADSPGAGDLGPEGMLFVPSSASPSGKNLVIVSNEVSGTITIYEVFYSIGLTENETVETLVYPNPTEGKIYFGQSGSYQVFNLDGKKVQSVDHKNEADLSTQPAGIYIIRDRDGNVARIIKK